MLSFTFEKKQYKSFVRYALETCDSFSLVFAKEELDNTKYLCHELFESLSEFILDKKAIGIHPNTGTFFEDADIVFFNCDKKCGAVLLNADSIFEWDGKLFPEELCFYRKKRSWFVSICHEKRVFILDTTKEDINFLKNISIKYWYEEV